MPTGLESYRSELRKEGTVSSLDVREVTKRINLREAGHGEVGININPSSMTRTRLVCDDREASSNPPAQMTSEAGIELPSANRTLSEVISPCANPLHG